MITVVFQTFLAVAVAILTSITVIHRLLISRQMSDKLYKNIGLALLCVAVGINSIAAIVMGTVYYKTLIIIKSGTRGIEETYRQLNNLIGYMNQQTECVIACIVFYGLLLLLVKSILKDIEIDFKKDKYRWSSTN